MSYNKACSNVTGIRFPICHDWNLLLLQQLLYGSKLSDYCDYIEFGWPIDASILEHEFPINMKPHMGAMKNLLAMRAYIQKELDYGALLGQFKLPPFVNYAILPVNLTAKKDGGFRAVTDLSWPLLKGVNSFIDKQFYQGTRINIKYPTVMKICQYINTLGRGCHIYKRDLHHVF